MSLSIGFPASSLLINGQTAAAATTASKTLIAQTATQAAAEDKEGDKKDDVNVDMNEIGASGSSSEGLSVTTANLLKRLAELQQQLEKSSSRCRPPRTPAIRHLKPRPPL